MKERENINLSLKEDCSQGDKLNNESSKTTNLDTQVISQDHKTNVLVSTQATQQDTFSADCNINDNKKVNRGLVKVSEVLNPQSSNTHAQSSKVQMKAWEWLPDGDWKVDGKLDPNFHDWLARKWMDMYQKTDLFMSKADVLAYFQKTPERLGIRWLQYQEENIARNKHKEQIGITTSNPQPNGQSQPSGNQNTVILSDGQRTIKSKDYTGVSKEEPEIPVNPKAKTLIQDWLAMMTNKQQKEKQEKMYSNQTQNYPQTLNQQLAT